MRSGAMPRVSAARRIPNATRATRSKRNSCAGTRRRWGETRDTRRVMRAVLVVVLVACGSGKPKEPPPENVAETFKQLEPKVKAIGALGPKFDAARKDTLPATAVPG